MANVQITERCGVSLRARSSLTAGTVASHCWCFGDFPDRRSRSIAARCRAGLPSAALGAGIGARQWHLFPAALPRRQQWLRLAQGRAGVGRLPGLFVRYARSIPARNARVVRCCGAGVVSTRLHAAAHGWALVSLHPTKQVLRSANPPAGTEGRQGFVGCRQTRAPVVVPVDVAIPHCLLPRAVLRRRANADTAH